MDSDVEVLVDDETAIAMNPAWITGPEFTEVVDCIELPDDGKVITLRTQSDVEFDGNATGHAPNERLYDVAGVPHVPDFIRSSQIRWGDTGKTRVSWRPVAKALLAHMVNWIQAGVEPPESVVMPGDYNSEGQFQLQLDP